jgi:hypothetical protein
MATLEDTKGEDQKYFRLEYGNDETGYGETYYRMPRGMGPKYLTDKILKRLMNLAHKGVYADLTIRGDKAVLGGYDNGDLVGGVRYIEEKRRWTSWLDVDATNFEGKPC